MATVGDVTVVVRADIGQFRTAGAQVEATTQRMGRAAMSSSAVVNKLERALGGMAFAAAGVPGPLGRIASILLQFSAGGLVTLGVVAGIGAIGAAYNAFTDQTKKAAEGQDILARAIAETERQARAAKTTQTISDMMAGTVPGGPRGPLLVGGVPQRPSRGVSAGAPSPFRLGFTSDDLRMLQDWGDTLRELDRSIAAVQPHLDLFFRSFVDPVSLEKMTTIWEGWNAEIETTRTIMADLNQLFLSLQTPADRFAANVQKIMSAFEKGLIGSDMTSELLQKSVDELMEGQEDIKTQWETLGASLGEVFARSFVRSAFDGFKNFGDVIKNVLATIIEEAVIAGLKKGFGKKGGDGGSVISSLLSIGATVAGALIGGPAGGAAAGTVAGGAFETFASASNPGGIILAGPPTAPRDPMSAARDAEWMHFLGESIRNFQAGGGRLG